MLGKIIDMNKTDAFISFQDGSTLDVNRICLPPEAEIGDKVNIPQDLDKIKNNTIPQIFF